MMAPFFLSYAREDSEFALRLAKDLRDGGPAVWIDQLDIPVGTRWDRAVEQALHRCTGLIIVLSPDSVSSENVLDEVSYALGKDIPVIPILYRSCEVPFRLQRLQYIDFTGEYGRGLDRLRNLLPGREQAGGNEVDKPRGPDEKSTENEPGRIEVQRPTEARGLPKWALGTGIALLLALIGMGIFFAIQNRAGDYWTLIVGSDDTLDSAQVEAAKGEKQGYSPVIFKRDNWYATTVGNFPDRKSAADKSGEFAIVFGRSGTPVYVKEWCPNRTRKNGYVECSR